MTMFRDTFGELFRFHERPHGTGEQLRRGDEFLDLGQGFYGETVLQTTQGPRRVAQLNVGDQVQTFSHGPQPILGIERFALSRLTAPMPEEFWPLVLPVGLMGNARPIHVAPEQTLLVHSDLAEREIGHALVLMPAKVLNLLPQVYRAPPPAGDALHRLRFEHPELVVNNRGAVILADIGSMFDDWADLDGRDTLEELCGFASLKVAEAVALLRREIEIDGGVEAHFAKHLKRMEEMRRAL